MRSEVVGTAQQVLQLLTQACLHESQQCHQEARGLSSCSSTGAKVRSSKDARAGRPRIHPLVVSHTMYGSLAIKGRVTKSPIKQPDFTSKQDNLGEAQDRGQRLSHCQWTGRWRLRRDMLRLMQPIGCKCLHQEAKRKPADVRGEAVEVSPDEPTHDPDIGFKQVAPGANLNGWLLCQPVSCPAQQQQPPQQAS